MHFENPYDVADQKFKMQTGECPDDSSENISNRSSSQENEEERKEREQYKILKQSLKALQERAQSNPKVDFTQGENSDDQNQIEIQNDESILLTDDKNRPQSSLAIVDNSYIQSSICDAKSNNSNESTNNEKLIDSLINDEDISQQNEEIKVQESAIQ